MLILLHIREDRNMILAVEESQFQIWGVAKACMASSFEAMRMTRISASMEISWRLVFGLYCSQV